MKLLWVFCFSTLVLSGCATPTQMMLDEEVRRLCAIDGGVRIFESVILPPIEYDIFASKNWVLPEKHNANPSGHYYVETTVTYYKEGNPQMSRRQHRVVRRSDEKVLGELITYGRGGGNIPGPWHESSFHCPELTKLPPFETAIFKRGQ